MSDQHGKATKGPWRVEFDDNGQANIHAENDEFWVALLPHQCVGSIEAIQKRALAALQKAEGEQ